MFTYIYLVWEWKVFNLTVFCSAKICKYSLNRSPTNTGFQAIRIGRNQSFSQGKTFFAEVLKLNLFIFIALCIQEKLVSSLVVVIAPWTLSLDAYWYISFLKILLSHQLQVIYVDYIRIMQTTQSVLFLTVWFRSVNDSIKDTHTKYLHPSSFSMPPRWSGTPKNYTMCFCTPFWHPSPLYWQCELCELFDCVFMGRFQKTRLNLFWHFQQSSIHPTFWVGYFVLLGMTFSPLVFSVGILSQLSLAKSLARPTLVEHHVH